MANMKWDPEYAFYVAVDAAVFTIINGRLHVLIIQNKFPPYEKAFALPGGRARNDEELHDACARVLKDETNVSDIYLKKFGAEGKIGRDPRNRVVSVAFLALIDHKSFQLKADKNAMKADWVPLDDVDTLAFDHNRILNEALDELRMEIQTTNIAFQLLPFEFTLSDLQSTYESILGMELDKRNFRKRIKALDIVEETGKMYREGAHRPAMLYRFKSQTYQPLKDRISVFV